jgi:hypothetical protein
MKNKKWCWLATEVKGGWRLKLALGNKDYNLVGAVFKTVEDVEMVTHGNNGSIVFVHLKDTKFPVK